MVSLKTAPNIDIFQFHLLTTVSIKNRADANSYTSASSFPLAFPVIWGRRYGC